ncbi:MAG: DNRLRE domain-containing protein [Clostridia bacterium]|nr:DNRLRE domain-containing protein [Clostridia bacterium]
MKKRLRAILSFVMMVLIFILSLPIYAFANGVEDAVELAEEIKIDYEAEVLDEKEELREENIKHYLLSDGTTKAVVYPVPVHYLNENGEWTDIDNTLSLISNEYSVNNKFEIKFAKKSGSSGLLSIKDGEYKITFTPVNANKSDAEIDNPEKPNSLKFKDVSSLSHLKSKVTYGNAYEGVDLEYILTGNNIKENIIVNKKLDEYIFEFEIKVKGLELSVQDGCVVFTDSETLEEKYRIPLPYMYDANGEYSMAVEYNVEQSSNNKYTLTVKADREWINSSSRAFPVVIDPSIMLTTGTSVGCVDSNGVNYSSNEFHIVGTSLNYANLGLNYVDSRLYYKANMPSIPNGAVLTNATVTYANLDVDNPLNIGAYKVTSDWTPSTLVASHSSIGSLSVNPYDIITLESTQSVAEWNITDVAKEWLSGTSNYGICLKALSNIGTDGYFASLTSGNRQDIEGPRIEITYIDTVGLENYFSYYASSAGGAGQGYINSFTGNLTFVHSIVSTVDEILPYTVSFIYNSQKGRWITSYSESIQPITLPDGNTVYNWTDSDGTSHLFSRIKAVDVSNGYEFYDYSVSGRLVPSNTGKYYDSEGLGLTIEQSGSSYILTDHNGNKKTFNTSGKLIKITDRNGNNRHFNYNSNGQLSSITLAPYSSGNNITQIMLEYTPDGALYQIVNCQTGVYATVTYSGSLISGIEYSYSSTDKYSVSFTYNGTDLIIAKDNKAMKGIEYGYTSGKATSVKELAYSSSTSSVDGDSATISYSTGETVYRSSGADKSSVSDDILTIYRFDYKGRVITAYSTDVTGEVVYGSSNYVYNDMYTDGESTLKTNNSIKSVVSAGANTPNLLMNPHFEQGVDNWILSSSSLATRISLGAKIKKGMSGGYGLKLQGTPSSVTSVKQVLTLADGTYTLSLSVFKELMSHSSTVRLSVYDANGNLIEEKANIRGVSASNCDSLENYWEREFLTFDISTVGNYTVSIEYTPANSSEYIYIDNIMLEKSKGMGTFSVYADGEFENGINHLSLSNATKVTTDAFSGQYSMRVGTSGLNTGESYVKYTYTVNSSIQKDWIVSAWAKASSSVASSNNSNSPSAFDIKVVINYSDGTSQSVATVPFNTEVDGWQYNCGYFTTSGAVSTIDIYLRYSYNCGYAYFDSVCLNNSGICTEYSYNGLGNTETIVSSDGSSITYTYNSSNAIDPISIEDGNGNQYDITYNSKHNITGIVDKGESSSSTNDDISHSFEYNNYSQTVSASTAGNVYNTDGTMSQKTMLTESTYYTDTYLNYFSKISTVTDERGKETKYFYQDNGLLSSIIGPDNKGIRYVYNAYGQLVGAEPVQYVNSTVQSIANQSDIEYAYNGKQELERISTSTVDYTFEYDVYGNVTSIKADGTPLATYTYGANNGSLTTLTYGNGSFVSYTYDELGRIVGVCYNENTDERVEYVYASNGSVSYINDISNGLEYTYYYDGEGKLISEKAEKDNSTYYSIILSYDAEDRVAQRELYYPDSSYAPYQGAYYSYNSDNRISSIMAFNNTSEVYSYDSYGRVTHNAMEYTDSYGYAYILDELHYEGVSSNGTSYLISDVNTRMGEVTLYNASYTYDDNGNITRIIYIDYTSNTTKSVFYVYDSIGQLIRENNQLLGKTFVYEYDSSGNILSKKEYNYTITSILGTPINTLVYTYGTDDKVVSVNGNSITYDAIGNPLSYYNGYQFTWQKGRRLASATRGSSSISYKYNSDGIRIEKTVDGKLHEYILDGATVLREVIYTGSTSNTGIEKDIRYYYDANGVISSATVYTLSNGTVTGTYNYIYRTNIQGDVLDVYNTDGTILVSYTYDAWGTFTESVYGTTTEAAIASSLPFRYRSYYYDIELGMYYLNTRYYDPNIGRFINADGQLNPNLLGYNLFGYCENNPIKYVDPTGKMAATATMVATNFWNPVGWIAGMILFVEAVIIIDKASSAFSNKTIEKKEKSKFSTDVIDEYAPPVFYGVKIVSNQWIVCTGAMTGEEALAWVDAVAIANQFGKDSKWGLYTKNEIDAMIIATVLGYGAPPIRDNKKGRYPHYHVSGHIYYNRKKFKYFHVWYGEIIK